MNMIIVTTCSNRKRFKPSQDLKARNLAYDDLCNVAQDWSKRTEVATEKVLAGDLYCGRGFREAEIAAKYLGQKPWVISAGLGVLCHDTLVPAYDLTLSRSSDDCVFKYVKGKKSPSDWWEAMALQRQTPNPLSRLVKNNPNTMILIACSGAYTNLIANDLLSLPEEDLLRIRIFGPQNLDKTPEKIRSLIMPYDARFDGPNSPLPGTKADFSQRVLRYFVETTAQTTNNIYDPKHHATLVEELQANWRPIEKIDREKKTDEEILGIIESLWMQAQGSSAKMLRILRDQEKIACEQGRFAALFRVAKERYTL